MWEKYGKRGVDKPNFPFLWRQPKWKVYSAWFMFILGFTIVIGCFTGTIRYMVPWLNHEIEEVDGMFAKGDPYPMGVEANRVTLEMLMKYLVDQSFVADPSPKVDNMFTRIVGWAE